MVLSRGNTLDYAEMYRAFAGHDPQIQPYLDYYGLNGGGAASGRGCRRRRQRRPLRRRRPSGGMTP